MRKGKAYLAMVLLVALLAAADILVLTSSASLSRLAGEKLRELFGDALGWKEIRASLDGVVTLEGVTYQLGGPAFRPQEAGRVVIRMRGGLVGGVLDRVVFQDVRLNLSDRLVDELSRQPSKRSIRDLFADPEALPRIAVRGGTLEADLPTVFGAGRPQSLEIRELTATPVTGYRCHIAGQFESSLIGSWIGRGETDLEKESLALTLQASNLRIEPRMREPLAPEVQRIYDKYLPGGLCDVTVFLGKEPGRDLDFHATLVAKRMTLLYKYFPYPVDHMEGEIDFFLDRFRIKHMTGWRGTTKIKFDGYSLGYPQDSEYHFRIDIEGMPLDSTLRAAIDENGQRVWDSFSPTGRVFARGFVDRDAGPDKPARIPLDLDIEGGSLNFSKFPYPLKNVSGELRIDGNDVVVKHLDARDGPTTVEVEGSIRDITGDAAVDLSVDVKTFPLDERLKKALGEEAGKTWDLFSPGGVLDARCHLLKEQGKALVTSILAHARGNTATYREVPLPLTELEGDIEVGRGRVRLHHLSGKTRGARIELHGEVTEEMTDLSIDAVGVTLDDEVKRALPAGIGDLLRQLKLGGVVNFKADLMLGKPGQKKFTLDLKLSKGVIDTEPKFEDLEGHVALQGYLDKEVLLQGPITFTRATLAGKRLSDVAASLNVKGSTLNFVNIKATAYGGLIAAKSFSLDTKTGEFTCESCTADRADIREFALDTKSFSAKTVAGKLSLDLRDLKGKTGDAATITGKGRLVIRDALLWDIPVFLKLFTLNPGELFSTRNQFDAGAVEFEIRDQKFAIDRLAFTSESVSVVGHGRINFDGGLHLTLKPKSGPLLGIDFFILKWAGELLSFLTGSVLSVEVTGTFEKPESRVK